MARQFPHLSEDALARHAQNHLVNSPRGEFRGIEKSGLSAAEIVSRLTDAADAATRARGALEAAEKHVEVGKAAQVEARIFGGLLSHAGLTEELAAARTDLEAMEAHADALFAAVAHVIRTVPDARSAMVVALERQQTTASAALAKDLKSIHQLEVAS